MQEKVKDVAERSTGEGMSQDMIAKIVAAFAQRSDVGVSDIVRLTKELAAAVRPPERSNATPLTPEISEASAATPFVAVDQAVSEDEITCLCCGKKFKTLKRHLMAAHGLSEAQYRATYGLSESFPLVAPSYSRRRSQVASESGFGTHERTAKDQLDAI